MNIEKRHLGWSYSLNREEFYGVYDTKEEAIEEAFSINDYDSEKREITKQYKQTDIYDMGC